MQRVIARVSWCQRAIRVWGSDVKTEVKRCKGSPNRCKLWVWHAKDPLLHFYKSAIFYFIYICVFFRKKKQQFEKEEWEHVVGEIGLAVSEFLKLLFLLSFRTGLLSAHGSAYDIRWLMDVDGAWMFMLPASFHSMLHTHKNSFGIKLSMKFQKKDHRWSLQFLVKGISWAWTERRPNAAGFFLQNQIGFVTTRLAPHFC